MPLSEADTRSKLIDPKLYQRGWTEEHIKREETAGTTLVINSRCFDNIFVERLWRTVKQEEVYLKEYLDVWEAEESLRSYFKFYNFRRPHQ